MRRMLVVALALMVCSPVGCDREREHVPLARERTPAVDVVARVGERTIGAVDVRERMALDGSTREAALRTLIDEELLLEQARAAGLTRAPEDERMIERQMVRALLRDLEKENTGQSIPDEEVQADFELHRDRFQVLERRSSWHVVAKADSEEARQLAASILREARRAKDPKEVFERYAEGAPESLGFEVLAEELPAITKKAGLEKAYKEALFAAKAAGPLREPVRTSYGWHAITVTEIQPVEKRTYHDVEDEIRARLSQKKRFERLVEVVKGLEAEGLVEYDEPAVKRLLAMPRIPEREE